MLSERRLQQRVKTALSADIHTGEEMFTARVRNLSMGGVGLDLSRRLLPQTNVALSLFLVVDGIEDALTKPLEVHCQVVWVETAGAQRWEAGLRFSALDQDQTAMLSQFIDRLIER